MKKLNIFFLSLLSLLLLLSLPLKAQLFYQVDTLEAGDSVKTISLNGKCAYYTVTATSLSPGGVTDTLFAYNVFNKTSPIRFVGISDDTDGIRAIIPTGSSLNYFLWDPYIDTLKLVRTNSVWSDGWKLIVTVKGITP